MDICAYCTASAFKIKSLHEKVRAHYKTSLHRDVLHLEYPSESDTPYDVFYFPYGALVCWGMNLEEGKHLLEELKEFEYQPYKDIETEYLTFSYGEKSSIIEDKIVLPNREILTKLAHSHGIAQSVKLGVFEETLLTTYDQMKHIPQELAKSGSISLSRKQIRKKMGELFIERSSINLHVDVLDTPEFFWEFPELESLYTLIANELELETRVEVLNQRLNVFRELFEMLGNELNHQHSSRLEWAIILLIVLEVVLMLLKEVFQIL